MTHIYIYISYHSKCHLGTQELCKDMNISVSTLEKTHQEHFEAAKKQEITAGASLSRREREREV